MSSLLSGDERLEQELTPEPVLAPATGAVVLHLGLALGMIFYGYLSGFFHPNFWGSKEVGGAIQVTLVTGAIPLPSEEINQNVLSTETPSEAPAAPAPKAKQAEDEKAIAISGKQKPKQNETVARVSPKVMTPTQDNRAQYGEQAGSSTPRAVSPQAVSIGSVTLNDADFGSRFGWYVEGINRKMAASWLKNTVEPRTPKGTRVYLVFSIRKDGSPDLGSLKVDRASGSPTLDTSCLYGVRRIDSFGSLPSGYNQSTLRVSYYCEY
jgi:protein TonB